MILILILALACWTKTPGLVVSRSCRSALVFCLVLGARAERDRDSDRKKKVVFQGLLEHTSGFVCQLFACLVTGIGNFRGNVERFQ